jgi:hypothetical protein
MCRLSTVTVRVAVFVVKGRRMMERIAIFLDYGNVHMLGHELFGHGMDKQET